MGQHVKHAVVDIETTGLEESQNVILELGIILYNEKFEEIDSFEEGVVDDMTLSHLDWLEKMAAAEPHNKGIEPFKGARIVYEMHVDNGLINQIRGAYAEGYRASLAEVSHRATDWLRSHNIARTLNCLPMMGSSIGFDRAFIKRQMPILNDAFHYRNKDVSTIKNMVKDQWPELAARVSQETQPSAGHRVLSDCRDTMAEYRFYVSHLGPVA